MILFWLVMYVAHFKVHLNGNYSSKIIGLPQNEGHNVLVNIEW